MANTVVGVLPPGFRFLSSEARLYFPFASRPEDRLPRERHSGGNSKHIIARLKPGATLAQAQAQIDAQNNTLERDDPKAKMLADAGFRSAGARPSARTTSRAFAARCCGCRAAPWRSC